MGGGVGLGPWVAGEKGEEEDWVWVRVVGFDGGNKNNSSWDFC